MKTLIYSVIVVILAGVCGALYFFGADARYINTVFEDYPAWRSGHISDCQTQLGGNASECECLLEQTMAWNTKTDRPPADTSIWDHTYIRSVFYADDWNEKTLDLAISRAIEKEVGPKKLKSQKAFDIRNRYFDEVTQAVTFQCFKGDKIYGFRDDIGSWRNLAKYSKRTYLVGRARAAAGLNKNPEAEKPEFN